ncbi:preprotein translocase subunit YajC [Corynebacterium testudinoris]|uniref:Preprotein translocase, YajC subunit n=1 Tax=Corynebacterium testudinoris TaxID=136857 RepID=A0A0G3HAI7_9CORY|nr:preprotein translocase subunit YajC [Corynebacterium testudinoris]AKK08923.1 preprotein translocase, YajC subunit [Corynebacterium testudinoris]MBX8994978.1 preprotein translocase subunit YajC [Corynebacterium testudinoris]
MESLLLVLLLAVFLLPSFFMMRSQRRRQTAMRELQNSVSVGDRIVNVAGIHGTVVAVEGDLVTLEVSPGVEMTMDRIGVMRVLEAAPVEEVTVVEEIEDHPENR